MSRKTFRIFLNSYLENFANISNFLFANFADLLDFLQLCHLLNFVCQPCRSFRCGRRYPASRSVLRPSSWGSGCALWECDDVWCEWFWCELCVMCPDVRMWWWWWGGGREGGGGDDDDYSADDEGVRPVAVVYSKMRLWWLEWWLNNQFELMMITMMIEQTGLSWWWSQWRSHKPIWAPCSLSSNRSRWSLHFWRRVIEKSYSWRGTICK